MILDENGEILSEIPVIPAAHKFSTDWTFDEEGHWNACENCDERSNYAEHNNGEWILDETGHWHECEDCGAVNDFAAHSNEWVSTEETHLEKCTVCNYKTEFVAHNNGEWISDETGHWHECEDCGTINDFAGHSGGENTCKSGAICEHCGMEYGEIDPHNHVGQTVIKNKMDTWFFADGYTGDTYCAGCDELFELGRTVPKTEYSSWNWWVWVVFILLLPLMIFFII